MITVNYGDVLLDVKMTLEAFVPLRYCRDTICPVTWHHMSEPRFHMISWNTTGNKI